jgi:hypothetical protein
LDAILANEEVCCRDAQHSTHRHTPVVGFLAVLIFGVLAKADWITKVVCTLLLILSAKKKGRLTTPERTKSATSRRYKIRCHGRETNKGRLTTPEKTKSPTRP